MYILYSDNVFHYPILKYTTGFELNHIFRALSIKLRKIFIWERLLWSGEMFVFPLFLWTECVWVTACELLGVGSSLSLSLSLSLSWLWPSVSVSQSVSVPAPGHTSSHSLSHCHQTPTVITWRSWSISPEESCSKFCTQSKWWHRSTGLRYSEQLDEKLCLGTDNSLVTCNIYLSFHRRMVTIRILGLIM